MSSNQPESLKPCPFCPGETSLYTDESGEGMGWVYCEKCGAYGPTFDPGSDNYANAKAIAAWNQRPIEDALRARVKELEGEIHDLSNSK